MTLEQDLSRALSAAAGSRPKTVYIKTRNAVYELNGAAVKTWNDKYYLSPSALEGGRIGKKIYQVYQGGWTKSPITERFPTMIEGYTPEGGHTKDVDIINFKAIVIEKKTQGAIRHLLAEHQHPKKNDMSHYKALITESKKVGWPKSFQTDLTRHDHKELEHRLPELPFGWILRESGTHLVFPEVDFQSTSASGRPSNWVKTIQNSFGENAIYYTWDGSHLAKRNPDSWGEWMNAKQRFLRGESEE
jgi:hypothetical protein